MELIDEYPDLYQVFNMAFGHESVGVEYDTWQEGWLHVISLCSPNEIVALHAQLLALYARFEDPAEFDNVITRIGVVLWLYDEPGGILAWRDRVLRMLEDHMRERGISLD